MDKPRSCGCKGRRTCLICEKVYNIQLQPAILNKENSYFYCPLCNKAWPGWDVNMYKQHPNHKGYSISYPGIYIDLNFLSEAEEKCLTENIDNMPWHLSQSGRRKQNFGPKCNFKKRKINIGDFNGFPVFSKFVQDKFNSVPILEEFQTIEQCSLEYSPDRGASIDPHIDDCWIWGERIVTVNLLSDAVLTLTYNSKPNKYNLGCIETYPLVLSDSGKINVLKQSYKVNVSKNNHSVIVRVPMPRRSLLVMYGTARYEWEHQVLREDISDRRICLAYREFTPPYLEHGEKYETGKEILIKSKNFWEYSKGA